MADDPQALEKYRRNLLLTAGLLLGLSMFIAIIIMLIFSRDSMGAALVLTLLAMLGGGLTAGTVSMRYRKRLQETAIPIASAMVEGIAPITRKNAKIKTRAFEELGVVPAYEEAIIDVTLAGEHRNTPFEVMDARLIPATGKPRGKNIVASVLARAGVPAFQGLLIAIKTPSPVGARILITADKAGKPSAEQAERLGLEPLRLPHEAFEEHFDLYASDAERALTIISPQLAETMVDLSRSRPGLPLQMAFRGSWFYLAMPRKGPIVPAAAIMRPADKIDIIAGEIAQDFQIPARIIDMLHGAS